MQSIGQITWPAVVAVCIFTSGAVLANMIFFVMIGKINTRLPESERISYVFWGTEVRTQFKRLFPGHKLILLLDACMVLMIVGLVLRVRSWVFG